MGNARKKSLKILMKMEKNSSYSNILLDDELKKSDLSIQDKKFVSALFYGVLERKLTLDEIIKKYSNKPADKLSLEVNNVLRLGLYQLLYMDSVPDSAAVDESVKLVKKNRNPAISGYVNGLLREFLRNDKKLPQGKTLAEQLMIEYSCPIWLVEKWLSQYGEKMTLSMLQTSIGQPPTTVKANTLKATLSEISESLKDDGFACEQNKFAKDCLNIYGSGSIEQTNSYKKGLFHVQDLSSQLCCAVIAPQPNDVVLDICSAPGGKTFTIAQLMNNQGAVHAFDLHENRVRLIRSGANRLGLSIINAKTNNGKIFNPQLPTADRVLCDVPCSGFGVIRRKPEIKYKNPDDFINLPEIQYEILETSSKYLKPGGILVYSTCTCFKAENDDVVERFLRENKDFAPCEIGEAIEGSEKEWKVTITPDKFGSDGFFIAKLKKLR